MYIKTPLTVLIASPDAALLAQLEALLATCGAHVEIVLSLEAAMAAIVAADRPALALLDTSLPGSDASMSIDRLLAAARAEDGGRPLSIVLISDTVTQTLIDRLAESVIDDLVLRSSDLPYWRIRIDMVLRNRHKADELETFREAAALNLQMDRLTGVYNRETILAMLFRETDRVQRMNGPLSLVLLDIDDFGHWNSRLGSEGCDDLLCQVAGRIARLQRSYDLIGRAGKDEFLLLLPGCSIGNAMMLAERIRMEVFCPTFNVAGDSIRLSACIGIAASKGRSPVVVLREAEQALQSARSTGPDSIHCFGDWEQAKVTHAIRTSMSAD